MKSDEAVLRRIRKYCRMIQATIARFGGRENFMSDADYQCSVYMNLAQIGELVTALSEEFRENTKGEIYWSGIRKTRNVIAHDYDMVNLDRIWDTVDSDIPTLLNFCERQINIFESQA